MFLPLPVLTPPPPVPYVGRDGTMREWQEKYEAWQIEDAKLQTKRVQWLFWSYGFPVILMIVGSIGMLIYLLMVW